MRSLATIAALVPALLLAAAALGGTDKIVGRVERVIDGDSFVIGGRRVRLWGIDAPELEQSCRLDDGEYACGKWSKRMLGRILRDQVVTCEPWGQDAGGAVVAVCYIPSGERSRQDVAGTLVSRGWAADDYRNSDGAYGDDQYAARKSKTGLWSGSFELPWRWRKRMGFGD